ncbi:hypothetical protein C5F47_02170 [Nitrosopumilus cobalaminigenes]|uniref:Uncharacterized protein n=1 Tax=Nitrosopumilus cobalaminigenes TaxID=1470066 RepID=A0A7D5LZW2_9ARCH|nr:hypothetical protein [Nitrosopumilus cobalaminigenes]QLH02451.1 hypothetical protein C5F47_02170 [Nitrosopumilus cobalaminigenes]
MEPEQIDEIIQHINSKYDENVPRLVKMLVRKKIGSLQSFDVESVPESLRNCTVEELIGIVKDGLDSGKLEL